MYIQDGPRDLGPVASSLETPPQKSISDSKYSMYKVINLDSSKLGSIFKLSSFLWYDSYKFTSIQ